MANGVRYAGIRSAVWTVYGTSVRTWDSKIMLRNSSQVYHGESQYQGEGTPLVLRASGVPGQWQFSEDVVQAHRQMVTRLMRDQNMAGRLSVVSSLRGEGVTFSSLAMATTLGHDFSNRVCYVDLNWWWPSPQMAELNQRSQGIAGILTNHLALDEVLVRSGFPNLCLLPAGQLSPDQRPVVARSSGLKEVLTQLSDTFDILVLDIPAILATSDALVLAALGDTGIMVIRQGVTPTAFVKQTLDDIVNLPIKGVLMNRIRVATPSWLRNWIPDL